MRCAKHPGERAAGPGPGARARGGFSLLEVLVALAVMSLSLAALYQALAHVVRNVAEAERHAHAVVLATSLLALHETIPQGGIDERGEHAAGGQALRWHLSASLLERPHAGLAGGATAASAREAPEWPLYRTEARVRWKAGHGEREVRLFTLKLEQPMPIQEPG